MSDYELTDEQRMIRASVRRATGILAVSDHTARRLAASESLTVGLLAHVYASETFEGAVDALAATIARNAPLTLKAAKASIRATAGLPGAPSHEDCEALALACFESDDFTEGRTAFLEIRTPLFKGR